MKKTLIDHIEDTAYCIAMLMVLPSTLVLMAIIFLFEQIGNLFSSDH